MIVTEILTMERKLRSAGFKPTQVLVSIEDYQAIEKEIGQPLPHSLTSINGIPILIQTRKRWAFVVEQ